MAFPLPTLKPRPQTRKWAPNELIDLRDKYKADEPQHSDQNIQIVHFLEQDIKRIEAETTKTEDPKKKKSAPFKIRALKKAIEAIENYVSHITSGHQAREDIEGVGKGIAERIDEILATGGLKRAETLDDNYVRLVNELTKISGIGLVKARKLIDNFKITGIDDLVDKYQRGVIKMGKNQLTHHQVIGLKWAKDISQKIPRAEVDRFNELFAREIPRVHKDLFYEICGSYRRGKAMSGDVDMLVSSQKEMPEDVLASIVQHLTTIGLIVDSLTSEGKTKYMGVAKIDQIARRLDIRVIPYSSWGAARLYFTGSCVFNQLFRGVALQRGFTLNEWGIYHFVNGERGDVVPTNTEEDVFDVVGIKYLTPREREF